MLYPHLRLIVEAIVKSLDPNNPQMRENLQTWVTLNLSELVKSFPMISFHAGTQRLACGAVDGVVIVYDLKTATRAQALEVGCSYYKCLYKFFLRVTRNRYQPFLYPTTAN